MTWIHTLCAYDFYKSTLVFLPINLALIFSFRITTKLYYKIYIYMKFWFNDVLICVLINKILIKRTIFKCFLDNIFKVFRLGRSYSSRNSWQANIRSHRIYGWAVSYKRTN